MEHFNLTMELIKSFREIPGCISLMQMFLLVNTDSTPMLSIIFTLSVPYLLHWRVLHFQLFLLHWRVPHLSSKPLLYSGQHKQGLKPKEENTLPATRSEHVSIARLHVYTNVVGSPLCVFQSYLQFILKLKSLMCIMSLKYLSWKQTRVRHGAALPHNFKINFYTFPYYKNCLHCRSA